MALIGVGIHPLHRQLAKITYMSMDKDGNLIIGMPELRLLMPLLKQNLALIWRLDELKELTLEAYSMGETDWAQELEEKIAELEGAMNQPNY